MKTQSPLYHGHPHLSHLFSQRKLLKFLEPVENNPFTQYCLIATFPHLSLETARSWELRPKHLD